MPVFKRGSNWYIDIQNDGRRFRKCIGPKKKDAEKVLKEMKAILKGGEEMNYEDWLINNTNAYFPWEIRGEEVLRLLRGMAAEGNRDCEEILREPVDDSKALRITVDFINSTVITCGAVAVAKGILTKQSTVAEVEAELERIKGIFKR